MARKDANACISGFRYERAASCAQDRRDNAGGDILGDTHTDVYPFRLIPRIQFSIQRAFYPATGDVASHRTCRSARHTQVGIVTFDRRTSQRATSID